MVDGELVDDDQERRTHLTGDRGADADSQGRWDTLANSVVPLHLCEAPCLPMKRWSKPAESKGHIVTRAVLDDWASNQT